MLLQNLTWPQVETYLKTNKTIIMPIGSTEQHGPTGLIGTDFLTANALAIEVGEQTNTLVAPALNFGMAAHHMAFSGTMSLKPSTYLQVFMDIFESFATHGFEKIFFINGHGGNIIPLQNAFCEWKSRNSSLQFVLENWWRMPEVQSYEEKHFGKENGFHATCGEVSLTMYTHPEAFEKIEKQNFQVEYPSYRQPLSASEFRKTFPDGRMFSNPGLSTAEHGKNLFDLSVKALIERVSEL